MVLLKSRDIEPFLRNPDFSHAVIMIYGPDSGLVSERADQLAGKSGVDLSDPFNVIRLAADDAASDPARIADEAHTIGMFGGKRLIRISGKTNRDLMKAIKPVLDVPPDDAVIIVEAGELNRSSALLRNLEKHPAAVCIPCYQDNDAALEALIGEEISGKGISIDRETAIELRSLLGSNRMLSRNELRKLALYCGDKGEVAIEDIRAIIGDGANLILSELIDGVATGDTGRLQELMPKVLEAGNSPDIILLSTLRHFQMIQRMRHQMETARQPAASLISAARPPIHFSRKSQITRTLSAWPVKNLSKAMKRLDGSMLECRRNSDAAASIAGTALLAIALEARTLVHRR